MHYLYVFFLGAFISSVITQRAHGTTLGYAVANLTIAPLYYVLHYTVVSMLWLISKVMVSWDWLTYIPPNP